MIETKKSNPSKLNRVPLVMIAISVLFRIAAAIYLGNEVVDMPGTFDQISYHQLALRVMDGHGFSFGQEWWPATAAGAPTAHWSFIYTLYLVAVYAMFGPNPIVARIIQAILVGILQPLVAYLLGVKVFSRQVGILSAALTMAYAYFVYYAGNLMTEPFYITTILAGLYVAILLVETLTDKRSVSMRKTLWLAVSLGLFLGLAVLLRQLFLLVIPFIFIWIWYATRVQKGRSSVPYLAVAVVTIAGMILPFTIYNYLRFHRFVLLNTNAGYAFFWGNHPVHGTHFFPLLPPQFGTYQELIPKELLSLDEAALEKALMSRGMQFVYDDPLRIILLAFSRIPEYIKFWPSPYSGLLSNIARVMSFGILWPFMLVGVLVVFFGRGAKPTFYSPVTLLLMYALIYSGIHILTWTLIRYRLPVDAVLLLFAANVIVLGLGYLGKRYPRVQLFMNKFSGIASSGKA